MAKVGRDGVHSQKVTYYAREPHLVPGWPDGDAPGASDQGQCKARDVHGGQVLSTIDGEAREPARFLISALSATSWKTSTKSPRSSDSSTEIAGPIGTPSCRMGSFEGANSTFCSCGGWGGLRGLNP